jgi:hypothetical protein
MCLAWGPRRTLLYNDSFARLLDPRHPGALGQEITAVFADAWSWVQPVVESALAGPAKPSH